MKQLILIFLLSSSISSFAQENKKIQFKDYFNEFHASVNHGIPFGGYTRTFFGGGLGMSHVFRADKIVGARAGLELDMVHFWDKGGFSHVSEQTDLNQHFYLTALTIPLNLRINFGKNTRFLFELGGRAGFVVSGYYMADVLKSEPGIEPANLEHIKSPRAPVGFGTVGLNAGIGTLIPLNEKLDLLIRPDFGANLFFLDEATRINPYARLCVGIHLK